jgi:23S rRNA pseudouridine1911/1915/1917 synthase
MTRSFVADRGDDGRRLDLVILRHLGASGRVSRARVQAWVLGGLVQVNDRRADRPARRVRAGDAVTVPEGGAARRRAPSSAPDGAIPPLDVLFEDERLLVVAKPPGLVVHPSPWSREATLLDALLRHVRARGDPCRPALVSRLDKDTTGVVVAAKAPAVHAALARAASRGEIEKDYLAIVFGKPARRRWRIRLPLGRDPLDRRRVVVCAGGRESVTEVERLAVSRGPRRGLGLLRCRLVTGRTHQVRVHLQACGLPLVGDPVYGDARRGAVRDEGLASALRSFSRQALHAWRVAFRHPESGAPVEVTAPLPDDMAALLAAAGLRAPGATAGPAGGPG